MPLVALEPSLGCVLSGIRMDYGGGEVLRGLDLTLARGRISALLGINGAGKSTLMRILAGLEQPTGGGVALAGPVAMVHQELSLLPDLSVAENLMLPRLARFRIKRGPVSWDAVEKRAAAALSNVGLSLHPRTLAGCLTTGELQLVEIARALDQNAAVLILDEPTSALSARECERLFSILRKIAAGGTTVLFVSHRLDEIREIADEVIVLRDGIVAGRLSRDEMTHDQIISLMTGGKLEGEPAGQRHSKRDPARCGPFWGVKPEGRRRHTLRAGARSVRCHGSGIAEQDAERSLAPTWRGRATGEQGILQLIDLTVAAKDDRVLASLHGSLALEAGTITGLAGLMGSGRSVFLRAVASRLKAAHGGAPVPAGDLRITGSVDGDAAAFLHEDRKTAGLFPELSALENVAIAERARDRFARARGLFTKFGVRARPADLAARLSGGNQQKLLLGRAMLSGARLLLLDEPTRGVDVAAREEIYEMMRGFASGGGAILWVSSDFDELVQLSNRLLTVMRGSIEPLAHPVATGDDLASILLSQGAAHAIH